MKTIITSILMFTSGLSSAWANNESNLPLLDSEVAIGRVKFRETLSGELVFVPALLSQRFFCNVQSGVCTLQIFNRMDEAEERGVGNIRASGRTTSSLRLDGVHTGLSIDSEELTGEIAGILPNVTTPKNLMLGENPYMSAVFKAPGGDAASLLAMYESGGLGALSLRYKLEGVARAFSIRVPAEVLEEILKKSVGTSAVTYEELKSIVKSYSGGVEVVGYSSDDAVVIISRHLKEKFLKASGKRRLKIDSEKIAKYNQRSKTSDWVIGETLTAGVQKCSLSLPIKKDSVIMESCEVEYESQ